jgi:hypothetical protein
MQLLISAGRTIRDIDKEFTQAFPSLKLEFYHHKHKVGQSSRSDKKVSEYSSLGELNKNIKSAHIDINPTNTVAEIEQIFQNEFGLSVQIFRRMGDVWLETTRTDSLTLEKQNNLGLTKSRIPYNINTLFL